MWALFLGFVSFWVLVVGSVAFGPAKHEGLRIQQSASKAQRTENPAGCLKMSEELLVVNNDPEADESSLCRTDNLDLTAVASEFSSANSHQRDFFGSFS